MRLPAESRFEMIDRFANLRMARNLVEKLVDALQPAFGGRHVILSDETGDLGQILLRVGRADDPWHDLRSLVLAFRQTLIQFGLDFVHVPVGRLTTIDRRLSLVDL